jgi:hypothetical protein
METRDERDRQARAERSSKRNYDPPDILSQEVFETTALACAKISGQNATCNLNKKNS